MRFIIVVASRNAWDPATLIMQGQTKGGDESSPRITPIMTTYTWLVVKPRG